MSAPSRALPLRKRPDIEARRVTFGTETYWIVNDPLSLRFFRLRDPEYAILQNLDADTSLATIQGALERQFAPQRTTQRQVMHFIARLYRLGLLIGDRGAAADLLFEQAREHERRRLVQSLANPWTIRFRGVDPQYLLDATHGWVRIFFVPAILFASVLMMIAAAALVAVNWDEFLRKLPARQEFFSYSSLGSLLVALGVVKILHELGHAYTCRRFGGRVTELGLLLLVGCPSLYCNVSDAWTFPDKWKRIAVSGAGIYVELMLASLATFGWWLSAPGGFHYVCLAVMTVCSVNTVLFNGNPFLRYDGYFMLADFMEIPNLAEEGSRSVRERLQTIFFGETRARRLTADERRPTWLVLYGLLARLYRITLAFSIYWFLLEAARPHGSESLVRSAGVLFLVGYGVTCLRKWRYLFANRTPSDGPATRRIGRRVGGIAALLLLIAFVPFSKTVEGPIVVRSHDAEQIVLQVPGTLHEMAPLGSYVQRGAVLARLTNDELGLEIIRLRGEAAEHRARLHALKRSSFADPNLTLRRAELEESLAACEKSLALKESQANKLTVIAGQDGRLIPPAERPKCLETSSLAGWSGLPQDVRNVGCTLEAGTLLYEIVDPQKWDLVISVDARQVQEISIGQRVDCVLEQIPNTLLHGFVCDISRQPLDESSPAVRDGDDLAGENDRKRPLPVSSYQVSVQIVDRHGWLRRGLTGSAKIHVESQSLALRFVNWFCGTFSPSL